MAKPTRMPGTTERIISKAPTGRDPADVRQRVEWMEYLLEKSIKIPGTRKSIGLDVVLDIVPFGGSTIAAALGAYMIWEAHNLDMPKGKMARMAGNVGFDWLLGMIPWVGAIPDLFFHSNSRNLKIIKRHLDRHHPSTAVVEN